jgi:hypothetical protein
MIAVHTANPLNAQAANARGGALNFRDWLSKKTADAAGEDALAYRLHR